MSLRELFFFIVTPFLLHRCFQSVLFGLGFFTGLIFLNPASLFWGLDKYRIPLIFALVLLVSAIKSRAFKEQFLYSAQHVLILLFFGILVLSAMNSYWPARSFVEIDNWFKLFIYFFLFSHICSSVEDINKINTVIIVALVILCIRGLYRYASGYPWVQGLPSSYIADRNDFALALAMALPLIDSLNGYFQGYKDKIIKILPFFVITTIILTFSRMGFILISFYMLLRFIVTKRKVLYIVVIVLSVSIGYQFVPETYIERIKGIKKYDEDASSMGRIVAWYAGAEMMKDHPFTGVGLNCFELPNVYRKYEHEFPPHVAHNTYVQLGAEGGVIALLFFMWIIALSIFQLIKLSKKTVGMSMNKNVKALIISFVIYLIGSVFISVENRELLYIILAETTVLVYIFRNKMTDSSPKAAPSGNT